MFEINLSSEDKDKLESKLLGGWRLPGKFFGENCNLDIYDFEVCNYNFLLDNSKSKSELLKGLEYLSPLTDDTLIIVKNMSDREFANFKEILKYERLKSLKSKMSDKYFSLIMPDNFFLASSISKQFDVPLGVILIKLSRNY